ncbi:MAG: hypothetical protein ACXQTZ_03870 [Candidatus Alkanophagales archaeon]
MRVDVRRRLPPATAGTKSAAGLGSAFRPGDALWRRRRRPA